MNVIGLVFNDGFLTFLDWPVGNGVEAGRRRLFEPTVGTTKAGWCEVAEVYEEDDCWVGGGIVYSTLEWVGDTGSFIKVEGHGWCPGVDITGLVTLRDNRGWTVAHVSGTELGVGYATRWDWIRPEEDNTNVSSWFWSAVRRLVNWVCASVSALSSSSSSVSWCCSVIWFCSILKDCVIDDCCWWIWFVNEMSDWFAAVERLLTCQKNQKLFTVVE